ncbi:RNA polymerase subunit sigma-70 [Pedobacter paludis]|uniref:RNA polymerase subunit sigma-70 n=2 Tax=Pedobacter paludis TaxID=2203212 RepID=A0A317F0G4_9SPHI|nr:RNA polymerase subunit sigma-70 [Pedobacter paludis]
MVIYSTHKDEELYALLKQGDKNAFMEIFERYYNLLIIYADKRLKNRPEAEDVVHEVYTSLWTRRSEVNIQTSLASYLYQSVRYQLLNIFAHQKIEGKYLKSLQDHVANFSDQADYRVREKDIMELINRQVDLLPTKMRDVFLLSRRENLTHREIAEVLGTTEENVARHITRALKILRTKLGLFLYYYMLFRFR